MDALLNHFSTDWAAMTLHDWMGMVLTIIVFVGMLAGYVMVFNPRNKEKFEQRRFLPLDHDEQMEAGGKQ
jgi:cytochrome c oxidase cbb3-type subunit 4